MPKRLTSELNCKKAAEMCAIVLEPASDYRGFVWSETRVVMYNLQHRNLTKVIILPGERSRSALGGIVATIVLEHIPLDQCTMDLLDAIQERTEQIIADRAHNRSAADPFA